MMDRRSLIFWSLPIARIFGTDVRVSWMLPLVGLIFLVQFFDDPIFAIVLFGMIVVSVLVHEFGHVFMARMSGGSADEIILSPLGGLAMAQAGPGTTAQILTAAAGPVVNLVFCLILLPCFSSYVSIGSVLNPLVVPISKLSFDHLLLDLCLLAFASNYMLMMINLLPVIPFDGGQILKSSLAPHFPGELVFRYMNIAGFVAAIALMVGGLLSGYPGLIILGAIVLAINLLQSTQMGVGEFQDDSFMGYDFSQGYTSLERSSAPAEGEPQLSVWQRWKARKQAEKEQAARERQQQDAAQLDTLLAKVHEQGIDSLTPSEKLLLQRVSTDFRQRSKRS